MSATELLLTWLIECAKNALLATGLVFWLWAVTHGLTRVRRQWRMRRILTAIRDQDAAWN